MAVVELPAGDGARVCLHAVEIGTTGSFVCWLICDACGEHVEADLGGVHDAAESC